LIATWKVRPDEIHQPGHWSAAGRSTANVLLPPLRRFPFRCLGAYLEEMKSGTSMRDFHVEFHEAEQPRQKEWLLENTAHSVITAGR
jgi:hypothetical protein